MAIDNKTSVVIVPGAWHNENHYSALVQALRRVGLDAVALSMPSIGENIKTDTLVADEQHIISAVETEAEQGKDVILLMHSAGGMAGSNAVRTVLKEYRAAKGLLGGIIGLVYMAAFAIPEGTSAFAATGGPAPWIDVRGRVCQPKPELVGNLFYGDLAPDVAEAQAKLLRPMSTGSLWQPSHYAAWKHCPSAYLVTELDQALPVPVQEEWSSREGSKFIFIGRLSASHSPFASMPDKTAGLVREFVERL